MNTLWPIKWRDNEGPLSSSGLNLMLFRQTIAFTRLTNFIHIRTGNQSCGPAIIWYGIVHSFFETSLILIWIPRLRMPHSLHVVFVFCTIRLSSVPDPWHFETDPDPWIPTLKSKNSSGFGSRYRPCLFRQWLSRKETNTNSLVCTIKKNELYRVTYKICWTTCK
jgi:hypothetical protein